MWPRRSRRKLDIGARAITGVSVVSGRFDRIDWLSRYFFGQLDCGVERPLTIHSSHRFFSADWVRSVVRRRVSTEKTCRGLRSWRQATRQSLWLRFKAVTSKISWSPCPSKFTGRPRRAQVNRLVSAAGAMDIRAVRPRKRAVSPRFRRPMATASGADGACRRSSPSRATSTHNCDPVLRPTCGASGGNGEWRTAIPADPAASASLNG